MVEYNIVYMTRKTVKKNKIAGHLVNNVVEDYKSLNFDLPGEDVLVVEDDSGANGWRTMYFNGEVNELENEAGAVIISPKKKQHHVLVRLHLNAPTTRPNIKLASSV
jgi:hypothetical protein